MAQALVQDVQLISGSDIRKTYADSHSNGQPLAQLPQVIDLLLAGKLNLDTWHDADSAGITYRTAEGKEMYAVIHGISKVNAENQKAFPEKLEGADLTNTRAAILDSAYARALVEGSGIEVIDLDDLLKGKEAADSVYAIVTTKERAAKSKHGWQSIAEFRQNEVGAMIAGGLRQREALADIYQEKRYSQVGVWLPSEVSGSAEEESLARLLYLWSDDGGLDGSYMVIDGRFVGVREAPEAQAKVEGHEQPNSVAIAMDAVRKYIPEIWHAAVRNDLETAFSEKE